MNYTANVHARSLSRGRSDTIGLVIPEINNPFFSNLAAAVEVAAEAAGLGVMLCSSLNRVERELDYISRLRKNFVDGLLFATNHVDDGRLSAAISQNPKVVLLDEGIAGANVPGVFSDNIGGGELATQHLIDNGHSRLAYVGGPQGLLSAEERATGFRQAYRAAGIHPDSTVEFFGSYSADHGAESMARILDAHPDVTGVFIGSDENFVGALGVLRNRGKQIGTDISVVTFDDAGRLDLLSPPVTAIRQNINELATAGIASLIDVCAGKQPAPDKRAAVELVVRSSVAVLKPGRLSQAT